jgi:hypothetical protein
MKPDQQGDPGRRYDARDGGCRWTVRYDDVRGARHESVSHAVRDGLSSCDAGSPIPEGVALRWLGQHVPTELSGDDCFGATGIRTFERHAPNSVALAGGRHCYLERGALRATKRRYEALAREQDVQASRAHRPDHRR